MMRVPAVCLSSVTDSLRIIHSSRRVIVYLQALKSLHDLYLGETRFNDAALAHLRTLTALEHLSLSDTRITAAGLMNLAPLARLKRLFLIGTDITAASAVELNQSLPKLTIIR